MQFQQTEIAGCFIIKPTVLRDLRGNFRETFNKAILERELGYAVDFVQDNQSISYKHVLRGIHFQQGNHAQAKLVRVVRGSVLDVVVDLRKESPTFGHHVSVELTEDNGMMFFMPRGMAHGFLALEDQTVFCYKCDAYYHPESEAGIIFDDPDLGIDWGVPNSELIVSNKDLNLPTFKELYP